MSPLVFSPSLRRTWTLTQVALVLLVGSITMGVLLKAATDEVRSQIISGGEVAGAAMRELLVERRTLANARSLEAAIYRLSLKIPSIQRITVVDDAGRTVADSEPERIGTPSQDGAVRRVIETQVDWSGSDVHADHHWVAFALNGTYDPERRSSLFGVLAIELDTSIGAGTIVSYIGGFLLIGFGCLFAFWSSTQFLLDRWVLAPIAALSRAAERFGRGEGALDMPVRRRDEIGQLAGSLKDMAERLLTREHDLRAARTAAEQAEQEARSVSEQLRVVGERLTLATEAARIGAWDLTLATGRLEWDALLYDLYRVDPAEASNTYEMWRNRVHPDDLAEAEDRIAHAVEGRQAFDTGFRIVWPGGEIRHIKAHGTVLHGADGEPVRFVGLNWDITDLKEAEAALAEASHRAEAASHAKGEFLANMSHEIRTPLNAILGLAHLLAQGALDAEQRDFVEKIDVSGRSLLGILNDILDFSKVEAGKLALETTDFVLDDVLDGLSTILSANVRDKNLEVLIGMSPEVPRFLAGDPMRLQQVLINIAGNAIKFTERGEVVIGVAVEEEDAERPVLRFTVRDTGIGISDEHRALLFAPFNQGDSSTTRRYGGSGLGLAICKRLVELMGGEIGVSSRLGVGTEFWFTVPFRRRPAPADHAAGRGAGLDHLNVLVVDDNRTARHVLTSVVRSLGWTAEPVDSGMAAIGRLCGTPGRANGIDVLLVDWRMPEMDGLETSRAVRQEVLAEDAPIVIMVTAHERGDVLASPDAGYVDGVLVKPVTPSALFNAVTDATARRRGGRSLVRAAQPARGGEGLHGLRVLLVEDNAINQEVARHILKNAGAAVTIAEDGRQAVERLRDAPDRFDIVLMDVQMPVMDGYEATRLIRAELGLPALPIIALTAAARSADRERSVAAGMDGFLTKPFDVDQMIAAIRRHARPGAVAADAT